MSNLNDSILFFASKILTEGTTKGDSLSCIIPSRFNVVGTSEEWGEYSDVIDEEIKATHFSLEWITMGKVSKISFFKGDGFGACLSPTRINQYSVELTTLDLTIKEVTED